MPTQYFTAAVLIGIPLVVLGLAGVPMVGAVGVVFVTVGGPVLIIIGVVRVVQYLWREVNRPNELPPLPGEAPRPPGEPWWFPPGPC